MHIPLVWELRWFIGITALITGLIHALLGVWWASPLYAFLLLMLFIARQLPRELTASPLGVLSPVDGQVIDVKRGLRHPELPELPVLQIRISQNLGGEYVLHSPIEGRVVERWWPDKSGNGEKNFGFVILADEGDRCVVDVVDAARPHFRSHFIASGQRTRQGQRCGLVGMKVTVDVYVADSSKAKVEAGDLVQAGGSILAQFKNIHRALLSWRVCVSPRPLQATPDRPLCLVSFSAVSGTGHGC
ncbi:MAG: hypothetical protein R3E89_02750 [Thiolinea sp.]